MITMDWLIGFLGFAQPFCILHFSLFCPEVEMRARSQFGRGTAALGETTA